MGAKKVATGLKGMVGQEKVAKMGVVAKRPARGAMGVEGDGGAGKSGEDGWSG